MGKKKKVLHDPEPFVFMRANGQLWIIENQNYTGFPFMLCWKGKVVFENGTPIVKPLDDEIDIDDMKFWSRYESSANRFVVDFFSKNGEDQKEYITYLNGKEE